MASSSSASSYALPMAASGTAVLQADPVDIPNFRVGVYIGTGRLHTIDDLTDTQEARLADVKRAYNTVIGLLHTQGGILLDSNNDNIDRTRLQANIFADTETVLYSDPTTGALTLVNLDLYMDDGRGLTDQIIGLRAAMDQFRTALNATKIFNGVISTSRRGLGEAPRISYKTLESDGLFADFGPNRDFSVFRDHIMKPYYEGCLKAINENKSTSDADKDAARASLRGEIKETMRKIALLDKRKELLIKNFDELAGTGATPPTPHIDYTGPVRDLHRKIRDADMFALYLMILQNEAVVSAAVGADPQNFDARAIRDAVKQNIQGIIESRHPAQNFSQRAMSGWFGAGNTEEITKLEEIAYVDRVLSPRHDELAFEHVAFEDQDHIFVPYAKGFSYLTRQDRNTLEILETDVSLGQEVSRGVYEGGLDVFTEALEDRIDSPVLNDPALTDEASVGAVMHEFQGAIDDTIANT